MATAGSQTTENSGSHPALPIRVIACEDNDLMRDYLVTGLAGPSLSISGASNGEELDVALARETFDIIILDIGLPGEDGFSIATRLRQDRPRMGIIMLTARDQVDDRVQGLDCGADLYFAKPVVLRELASAIGSLHRRMALASPAPSPARWRLDALRSCLITPSGIEVPLTDNEHRFLAPLLKDPGSVVDRDDLSRALDHLPDIYAMRRMETLLSRLRAKVQRASPEEALPVRARHGRGYAFLGEADSLEPPRRD